MDSDDIATLKQNYMAAMSQEMKAPLEMILGASGSLDSGDKDKANQIQDAAKYLLGLVDELARLQLTIPKT